MVEFLFLDLDDTILDFQKAEYIALGKTGAAEVIENAGFDANVRGETLSIPEFARIANEIVRRRAKND